MAKKITTQEEKTLLAKDRTIFWSDLAYVPPELKLKDPRWFAQNIYFAKKNSSLFLDPKRAAKYRKLDLLEVDEKELKQMFDPITPLGAGGEAKYVSGDWKANPIYLHLKNIVKAEIQRTSKKIEVNFKDKYAPTRKMRDNYRILGSKLVRDLINLYAPRVGLKGISQAQDPYKWIRSMSDQVNKKDQEGKPVGGGDVVSKITDLIKNQIESDQDLVLYNELIYRGDYEQAIEKGIQFYMFEQNKWDDRWSDEFIDNIMLFNKCCGEWYTDQITGRPVIEGFIPEILWTSPFRRKDGSDLMHYFIEYNITFADFVRTMGHDLSPEKLKQVFDYNKTQGSRHGLNWLDFANAKNGVRMRDNAQIRVGKISVLTQDYDVFMDRVNPQYPLYEKANYDWYESDNTPNKFKAKRDEKHYNVWYSCYYIPPTTESLSNADFAWQAQFIFDIKKNQDQFRYGEDGRYSVSPLVIYENNAQPSFYDIVASYMSKIDFCWQRYQSCLISDIDGIGMSDEFLGAMLRAVDEDNKINPGRPTEATGGNDEDAAKESWKMLKQGNFSFLKFTDKQGKRFIDDPNKMFIHIKNGQLERAKNFFGEMMNLYNQMVIALSTMDSKDVKTHVPVSGLQEIIKNSDNAIWYIQKQYEGFVKMYAERFVRYILMIKSEPNKYGYTKRLEEFKDILGLSNGLLIEGMEDVAPESIGLSVNYTDNTSKLDFIRQLALKYIDQGKIDDEIISLILGEENWKTTLCYLRLNIKQRKKEEAAKQQLLHQQQMEDREMQLKIAQALQKSKSDGKDQNIQKQGEIDAKLAEIENQLKAMTMASQKEQLKNNKLAQEEQKHELNRSDKTFNELAPGQV